MSAPAKWDWNIGNINATAAQTQAAYKALTGNGPTRNFSVIVWNDIVDKIIEQRQAWGDVEWSQVGLSKGQTWMIPGERMTAKIFNTAVMNMPPVHPWRWEETLGRKDIQAGDTCFGAYFIYLTEGLNHWIEDLSPVYINPHVPFNIRLTFSDKTVVLRALHVASDNKYRWTPKAKINANRAIHVASKLNLRLVPRLYLPLFNVAAVEILLIGNTRIRNTVIAPTAAHVIGSNDMTLDLNGCISFGDVVFLFGPLDSNFSGMGTLGVPDSISLQIAEEYALLDSPVDISVLAPTSLSGGIISAFSGAAYVREPDSILVKVDMPTVFMGALTFTTSDLIRVIADLPITLTPSVKVFQSAAYEVTAALDVLLSSALKFSAQTSNAMTGNILGQSQFSALMDRKLRTVIIPPEFIFNSSMSALAVFAARELYTSGDITSQFDTTAWLDFATKELRFSGTFSGAFSGLASLEFSDKQRSVRGSIFETLLADATAELTRGALTIHSTSLELVSEASASIFAPNNPEYTAGTFSGHSGFAATFGSGDFLGLSSNIFGTHSGEADLDLDTPDAIKGLGNSEFTGHAAVMLLDAVNLSANARFNHTGAATFASKRYTLASEIDDVLVSDLDDIPVADVEFHI